jgi:hypothetical protein
MRARALLVTGVHREELGFGDRVAALLDAERIDVLRIPEGITQRRTGTGRHFYVNAQHREIYLQLRQQVRGRYALLIDLHSGIDRDGPCADVFCRRESFLACLAAGLGQAGVTDAVRLIRILADGETRVSADGAGVVEAAAHTWIPRAIWDRTSPLYVGLEVYLPEAGEGGCRDWRFACGLIEAIRDCAGEEAAKPT